MYNPVEINFDKTYRPKGTLTEQVRKHSGNGNAPMSPSTMGSPISPLYGGFHDVALERPHGAENLIPKTGSQADLRKQMGSANL
ncbi:unnamed protein product [Ambrosiozyma monospora]|uniref:Unnamed protein product n=1 Tax=Ambrosiozyma monospora TaxID=43982 RepID=A0ACB5U3W8_AMBMO|nr:unnamed protein product [Ambrosiozyma monospora]